MIIAQTICLIINILLILYLFIQISASKCIAPEIKKAILDLEYEKSIRENAGRR
jgi:hypothetical protein